MKVSRYDNDKTAVIRRMKYSASDVRRQTFRICDWDDRRICRWENLPTDYVTEL